MHTKRVGLFVASAISRLSNLFSYLRLLKKLLCLVCCHAASGNSGSVVFLWRAAHPNWDVWTAPARVWSEDAPETPAKART